MQQKKYVIGLIIAAVSIGLFFVQTASWAKQDVEKARANLGRHLFYDTKLSYNLTKSCVSCHDPSMAFTDGYRTSAGADGFNVKHNAISLLNVKYRTTYTWTDSSIKDLTSQLHFPFFNTHPVELGWANHEPQILQRFATNALYQQLFAKAFPGNKQPFQLAQVQTELIAFEGQLVSYGSAYDRYISGQASALNPSAKAGLALFNSAKLNCNQCHQWTKPFQTEPSIFYQGIRVPSLRNVMLTAPYMHNGQFDDLFQVFKHYETSRQIILNKQEEQQLMAFLSALTDTSYISNTELLNPFQYR